MCFNNVFSLTSVNFIDKSITLYDNQYSYLLLTDCSFPSVMRISDASEHVASCNNCHEQYTTQAELAGCDLTAVSIHFRLLVYSVFRIIIYHLS